MSQLGSSHWTTISKQDFIRYPKEAYVGKRGGFYTSTLGGEKMRDTLTNDLVYESTNRAYFSRVLQTAEEASVARAVPAALDTVIGIPAHQIFDVKKQFPWSRMKILGVDYVEAERWPGARAQLKEILKFRENMRQQRNHETEEEFMKHVYNDPGRKESWDQREKEGLKCLLSELQEYLAKSHLNKPSAEQAQVPAQEVVSASDKIRKNDAASKTVGDFIRQLPKPKPQNSETVKKMEKMWDRARQDHVTSLRQAGQSILEKVLKPKAELKKGFFTPEEVSLCNAIPLLALVRFVCILTPTSFSLFILQDEIILRMYAENDTRGVFERIGEELRRTADSVRQRYGILSREKQGSENTLKKRSYTAEEVSLCNAIPLLALVRFVCILTPTSFSLFILQDEIILRMYAENDTRGVFERIAKKLNRSAESVRKRYVILSKRKGARERTIVSWKSS